MAKDREMIKPFTPQLISKGKISYGLSSYGYDIRLDNKFKVFDGEKETVDIIDPKKVGNNLFRDIISDVCIIPAHSFVVALLLMLPLWKQSGKAILRCRFLTLLLCRQGFIREKGLPRFYFLKQMRPAGFPMPIEKGSIKTRKK